MKLLSTLIAMVALPLMAQVPTPTAIPQGPLFVKGGIAINYLVRQQGASVGGPKNVYNLNINVSNSALMHGTILDTPQVISGWPNKTIKQGRSLQFDISLDIVNPKHPDPTDPKSVLNVGRMSGRVPIHSDGTYNYDEGNVTNDILPIRQGSGFSSRYYGVTVGKPLGRPANWMETLNRKAVSLTRSVNGRRVTVVLNKYDKMEFRQNVIGAGPTLNYPVVKVNGEMLYDYIKNCWFLNNVTHEYESNGTVKFDRLTGTIRWIESPERATNGEGEYQFDIRLNEPSVSADTAFQPSKEQDDSAFFDTDSTLPSVTGTMKYKDNLSKDGTTVSSAVTIDLQGNNITKAQLMNVTKMVLLSAVVPMNDD
jgi:hypothetical protein